jgi:mono/diheme cytochrome c family protein
MLTMAKVPVAELVKDERAMKIGARLFANNCSVCHGTSARGAVGFPNLTDNDWLYGGAPEQIHETILNGRNGAMPAWIDTLGEEGVEQVANYVLALSGRKADATLAAAGQEKFAVCAACHGADGKGNPMMGAPNLTDNVWLYGGSLAAVKKDHYRRPCRQDAGTKRCLGAQSACTCWRLTFTPCRTARSKPVTVRLRHECRRRRLTITEQFTTTRFITECIDKPP